MSRFLVGLSGAILIGGWRFADTGIFHRIDVVLALIWFILWCALAVSSETRRKSGAN